MAYLEGIRFFNPRNGMWVLFQFRDNGVFHVPKKDPENASFFHDSTDLSMLKAQNITGLIPIHFSIEVDGL